MSWYIYCDLPLQRSCNVDTSYIVCNVQGQRIQNEKSKYYLVCCTYSYFGKSIYRFAKAFLFYYYRKKKNPVSFCLIWSKKNIVSIFYKKNLFLIWLYHIIFDEYFWDFLKFVHFQSVGTKWIGGNEINQVFKMTLLFSGRDN